MGGLKIVKLRFRSAVHLGANVSGIGIEDSQLIAHSDTVFSCLINSYAQLHSGNLTTVKELLKLFREGKPPFRITSAFPYQTETHNSRRVVYYLPQPLVDPPNFVDSWAKRKYGKLVRNTQLVRITAFQNWLKGEEVDLPALEDQNIGSFCTREIRPQHARDRLTDAANIYHSGLVHFHRKAGLYFLVELNRMELSEFQDMLKQAGMNGLGGRRSHGNGVFKVTDETISDLDDNWKNLFNLPVQNGFINLSLYLPEPETFANLDPVAYQLVPRKGWCYSSVNPTQMKRQTVTMFGEGSVFRNQLKGTLEDVTPKKSGQLSGFTTHKIYRYGIPISLPIKI